MRNRVSIDEETLREMYLEDKDSIYVISGAFDVCPATVYNRLCEMGIVRSKALDLDMDAIRKMYVEDGMTVCEIAEKLGVGDITVYNRLCEMDVMRSMSDAVRAHYGYNKVEDLEQLRRLYVDEEKSIKTVAEILGVSQYTVYGNLCELGINRSIPEAMSILGNDSPNSCELMVYAMVESICPGEFGLNVDGEMQDELGIDFGRRKPDILSLNGRKQIVLFNGCAWHCCPVCETGHPFGFSSEDVQKYDGKSIEFYERMGYAVLTIWEHELYSVNIRSRIAKFVEVKNGIAC